MKKATQLQGITDLTVLARVRTGFVPGAFNTVTYADRLTTVLRVLNMVRQASREAALQRSPFADSIGRFRAIHFFRFAVMPSIEESPGPHQLLLNVTFDGGWEPYMRVVWGPLGKLLDLMFCNCEGYPMAFHSSFDKYMAWVREKEVASSFFYADSASTVADSHYLRELEELQCGEGARAGVDAAATSLALAEMAARTVPSLYAVTTSLRVLKAVSSLRDYFPGNPDQQADKAYPQDQVLLRFARDLLGDLRDWMEAGMFNPGGAFDMLGATLKHERKWLMSLQEKPSTVADTLVFDPANVQAGIVSSFPADVRDGVLVLLRIADVARAKTWLATAPVTPANDATPDEGIFRTLALTYSGLQRLKLPYPLDPLPHEFKVGMEARAGVLGDLRSNHPDHWQRPRRNWPGTMSSGPAIELSTVHVLVQFRIAMKEGEPTVALEDSRIAERLWKAVDELETKGLKVLYVQPMRLASPRQGEKAGRDHFGYVDGISQPTLSPILPSPSYWSDQVKPGDIFLGYSNTRGDKPENLGPANDVLDNGTFLVVRKLRQFPERLDALIADAARRSMPSAGEAEQALLREDIKAKIMGRHTDGRPLAKALGPGPNDFDYQGDRDGAQCPHRSHIRRANPRGPLPARPAPRIVRRGMSYGPPGDEPGDRPRGVVFMAYNASIAEQFEVIQRWLVSGNSSGLSSSQDDPLVGVPEIGQRRMYRYVVDGKVVRVDLGEKPLVQLEWGIYAFVPSIKALRSSAAWDFDTVSESKGSAEAPPLDDSSEAATLEAWRLRLENEWTRAATWKEVRGKPGGVCPAGGYGLLVGSRESVSAVLKDDGGHFSVVEYGKRMEETIGRGFLGMDDVGDYKGHLEQAAQVNRVIMDFADEEAAYKDTFAFAGGYLQQVIKSSFKVTGKREAPIDVIEFGRRVLALLCEKWFGLPDSEGQLMRYGTKADDLEQDGIARCPGHFMTVSRHIFTPHPLAPVSGPAKVHAALILRAVRTLLQEAGAGRRTLTPLVRDIVGVPALAGDRELQASTVAGVMLGFPPTVLGNLVTVLIRWIDSGDLWELQQDLPASADFHDVSEVLRSVFLSTMSEKPVPYVIFRTAMSDGSSGLAAARKGDRVVLGLGSAVAADKDPESLMLMFGGQRQEPNETVHACPGYGLAMGVMLGSIAALLKAGTLARTADPRTLVLTGLPE